MQQEPSRILLVEDNYGDARLLKEYLNEYSSTTQFDLTHVDYLDKALTLLAQKSFDLILLDLSLPDEQGLDTVTRTHEIASHIPIVVLTGMNDDTLGLKAVQSGAQDYLIKGQMDSSSLIRSLRYAIERHRLMEQLNNASLTDELTGLYNRRGFLTFAEQHWKLARRTRSVFTIIFADLDRLKYINDTFGHHEGDYAIKKAAELIRKSFRDTDILARLGGDEFTCLAIDASGEGVDVIVSRLMENIREYNSQADRSYELSMSVGMAGFDPNNILSLEDLMKRADATLYENKRSKRKAIGIEQI
jgi:two-component system, cell cycle response regulator